jgi:hypothetical protein
VLVGRRPGIISGIQSFITALSSVYSISAKAWCLLEHFEALLEEGHTLVTLDEAQVRDRVDEARAEPKACFLVR